LIKKKITITNATGLHVKPAGVLCDNAVRFESSIRFIYNENCEASAKSILSVLAACIRCGDEIELICEGSDEEEAMETISSLFERGFDE
jgi:phosphocarrier protein